MSIQRLILVWLADGAAPGRVPVLAADLVRRFDGLSGPASVDVGVKREPEQGFDLAVRIAFADDEARASFDAAHRALVDEALGAEAGGIKQYDFVSVGA